MGRGGDDNDGTNPLYGKLKVRRPERSERPPGICGDLQAAGVSRAMMRFEIWEDDHFVDGDLENISGKPVENDELAGRLDRFLSESLRESFSGFLFDGISGTATFDAKKHQISVDLYERYTRSESDPWNADLTNEVARSMKKIGADAAEVNFDGYGDSGSVDSVNLYRLQKSESDDPEMITFIAIKEELDDKLAAEQILADYVYDQLEARQAGWENNEGAYGSVQIELGKGAEIDFNYRIEDSRLHKVSIDPKNGQCQVEAGPPEPV